VPHDPDPALRMLWRHAAPAPEGAAARRGPKQKLTVDEVVDAAIELADRDGLAALSMRGLAQQLGLGAMTLYTYVPGRNELVVLMVDQVLGRTELPELPDDLRERLELVARTQHADVRAHPWLLEVTGVRPWLGPNMGDRYEWQLSAVEGIGLDDIAMDQTVALLAGFATNIARAEHERKRAERESGMTELEWWEANAETLGELMAHRHYPLAGRVGTAAGEAYQAASDPGRELEFGLARIIDGLIAHLETK
jgi:AcrR family transcriptional regulator